MLLLGRINCCVCVVIVVGWNDILCRLNDLLDVTVRWFIRCRVAYGTMSFDLVGFGVV